MEIMTEAEALVIYDEYLDCDGDVAVAGMEFQPSRIIKELDPIAYRCGFSDFCDMENIEIDYDLDGE